MGVIEIYHTLVNAPHSVQCYFCAAVVAVYLVVRPSTKPVYKRWRPANPNAPIIRKLRESEPK